LASRKFLFRMLPYSIVLALAVLVTWATSFLGLFLEHGLPFAWRFGGCPGPHILMACVLDITYDWAAFGLDVLFYATIGYGLILVYKNYQARKLYQANRSMEKEPEVAGGKTAHPLLRFSNLSVAAVLITFFTGNFFGHWTIILGGWFFQSGYGFPFNWIITAGCSPFAESTCIFQGYSLLGFLLDVLFYAFAGYGLLSYARSRMISSEENPEPLWPSETGSTRISGPRTLVPLWPVAAIPFLRLSRGSTTL
jgi:hypothetical protein